MSILKVLIPTITVFFTSNHLERQDLRTRWFVKWPLCSDKTMIPSLEKARAVFQDGSLRGALDDPISDSGASR